MLYALKNIFFFDRCNEKWDKNNSNRKLTDFDEKYTEKYQR